MSLLEKLRKQGNGDGFEALGYTKNPFPPRGQVQDEVYAERQELAVVEESLAKFLRGDSAGRTWAIAGESGVGKSNFLRHITRQLQEAEDSGLVKQVAHRYLTSQQMTPRQLAESIAVAIGGDAFAALFTALAKHSYDPNPSIEGTALGDFLQTVATRHKRGNAVDPASAAKFAIRWLGGQQTYSPERQEFGIAMRERMPPAVALPWLRHLLDLMEAHGILSRLVLLLDEFEDVQSLSTAVQNDYLMTLKGLINAFNLDRLFLVLAGQPASFERMGQRFPSLKSRWEVLTIDLLRKPEEAVRLARQYLDYEHRVWAAATGSKPKTILVPDDVQLRASFGELLAAQPSRGVTQRDFLARMHEWLERQVREE